MSILGRIFEVLDFTKKIFNGKMESKLFCLRRTSRNHQFFIENYKKASKLIHDFIDSSLVPKLIVPNIDCPSKTRGIFNGYFWLHLLTDWNYKKTSIWGCTVDVELIEVKLLFKVCY